MLARYLPPATPTLRSAPPCGEQWPHDVKFDGWQIQLHKHGGSAAAQGVTTLGAAACLARRGLAKLDDHNFGGSAQADRQSAAAEPP